LTGSDKTVLQIKTKIDSCHTVDSKPVKQEVNGTVLLPPLVLSAQRQRCDGLGVSTKKGERGKERKGGEAGMKEGERKGGETEIKKGDMREG